MFSDLAASPLICAGLFLVCSEAAYSNISILILFHCQKSMKKSRCVDENTPDHQFISVIFLPNLIGSTMLELIFHLLSSEIMELEMIN